MVEAVPHFQADGANSHFLLCPELKKVPNEAFCRFQDLFLDHSELPQKLVHMVLEKRIRLHQVQPKHYAHQVTWWASCIAEVPSHSHFSHRLDF